MDDVLIAYCGKPVLQPSRLAYLRFARSVNVITSGSFSTSSTILDTMGILALVVYVAKMCLRDCSQSSSSSA